MTPCQLVQSNKMLIQIHHKERFLFAFQYFISSTEIYRHRDENIALFVIATINNDEKKEVGNLWELK